MLNEVFKDSLIIKIKEIRCMLLGAYLFLFKDFFLNDTYNNHISNKLMYNQTVVDSEPVLLYYSHPIKANIIVSNRMYNPNQNKELKR